MWDVVVLAGRQFDESLKKRETGGRREGGTAARKINLHGNNGSGHGRAVSISTSGGKMKERMVVSECGEGVMLASQCRLKYE